jgi:pimeloyl-[acyl-carrier protein] methyl ester esterase
LNLNQRHTLVLLPGLDGTGKLFSPIIPLLAPHFELVVITYPDLDSFTDYVDCALNQLPQTPGFSLLAESFSGPVAIALMAQRPDLMGPSILCATFARSPLAALTRMANYVPEQMFSIGALNEFCLDVYATDDDDNSETQPLPLNVTEQLDGALLKHRIAVFSRIDVSALLPNIEVPILYLHATRDRIAAESDAQMIQEYLPAIERVDIDAPHLLLQTRPQQCAELIFQHVQSHQ